jgi:hypothetical protein
MKKVIRISLGFATFDDNGVNCLAILLIVCFKNNLLFPNPPISIAVFTELQTAFQNAITAKAQGGKINTVLKSEARDALISAMRQWAGYVQSLAPTLTLSQVLTSGFDVVIPNTTPVPLTPPVFTLDNSLTTRLAVYLEAVTNAKAYQVQYAIGAGPWLEAGVFPNTRNIFLTNLTPGTVYNVRIRAIGGSTQCGEWSGTVSLMAT